MPVPVNTRTHDSAAAAQRAPAAHCADSQFLELARNPFLVTSVALAIRLAAMFWELKKTSLGAGPDGIFHVELASIAHSIALGKGYSSPFGGQTGPTAFSTPIYPYLMAFIFRCFGVYTSAASYALLSMNSFLSALTCVPILHLGRRLFGERVGILAAWTWVFLPSAILIPVTSVLDASPATFLFTSLMAAAVALPAIKSPWAWAGFGIFAGSVLLFNPAPSALIPFIFIWLAFHLSRLRRHWLAPLSVAALALLATVAPWFIRNYYVFHAFVPFRTLYGMELSMGNNWQSYRDHVTISSSPFFDPQEYDKYARLGEIAYMAERRRMAFAFIAEFPRAYAGHFADRIANWWLHYSFYSPLHDWVAGPINKAFFAESFLLSGLCFAGVVLAIRERRSGSVLLLTCLAVFPLPYYAAHINSFRYRYFIEPEMVLLAVFAALHVYDHLRRTPLRPIVQVR